MRHLLIAMILAVIAPLCGAAVVTTSPPSAGSTVLNGTSVGATATTAGTVLGGSGTDIRSLTLAKDATIDGSGNVTLASNATARTDIGLGTASSPAFTAETLSANTNWLVAGTTNTMTLTMAALTASRIFTVPDANSNSVVPSSAAANQFANGISSGGVVSYAQPAFSNLSGTATSGQLPTMAAATSSVAGTQGAAPQPAAGAENKVLCGDATYHGGMVLLAQSAVGWSCPADVTLDTLTTYTMPANTVKANGQLMIRTLWQTTNSSNNKTINVTVGATAYLSALVTTNSCVLKDNIIYASGTSSAIGILASSTASYSAGTAVLSGVDDFTTQLTISFKGQKASSGETLTLSAYSIWVCNP